MITITYVGETIKYTKIQFPSGEIGIELVDDFHWTEGEDYNVYVAALVCKPADIMELFLVLDAVKHRFKTSDVVLNLPYIPFGRQDRYTTDTSSFSLKIFADILNSFELKEINTTTPHSNVSGLLINNLKELPDIGSLCEFLTRNKIMSCAPSASCKNTIVISPDAGAEKRAYTYAEKIKADEVVVCSKRRDPKTGEILGMTSPPIPENKHLVVIDDICDGGRTFIELAKIMPKNRKSLLLYVTHGIFSKGRQVLFDAGYDHVHAAFTFIEKRLKNESK